MTEKGDPMIGIRAAEAVNDYCIRHNIGIGAACIAMDVNQRQLYNWQRGVVPNGIALQNLANHDADVHYILTGRREGEQNAEQDH